MILRAGSGGQACSSSSALIVMFLSILPVGSTAARVLQLRTLLVSAAAGIALGVRMGADRCALGTVAPEVLIDPLYNARTERITGTYSDTRTVDMFWIQERTQHAGYHYCDVYFAV